jgi:hypothetical protein
MKKTLIWISMGVGAIALAVPAYAGIATPTGRPTGPAPASSKANKSLNDLSTSTVTEIDDDSAEDQSEHATSTTIDGAPQVPAAGASDDLGPTTTANSATPTTAEDRFNHDLNDDDGDDNDDDDSMDDDQAQITVSTVDDVSGPCDEAEHASDPACSASGDAASGDDHGSHGNDHGGDDHGGDDNSGRGGSDD